MEVHTTYRNGFISWPTVRMCWHYHSTAQLAKRERFSAWSIFSNDRFFGLHLFVCYTSCCQGNLLVLLVLKDVTKDPQREARQKDASESIWMNPMLSGTWPLSVKPK